MAYLNLEQTAAAFGVSLPTVRGWIRLGMPVVKEGTNGAAYEIDPSAVTAWLRQREDAERAARQEVEAASAQVTLFLGGDVAAGKPASEPLSIEEKFKLVQMEQLITKLRRDKGELVPLADVQAVWSRVLIEARAQLTGLPDRLAKHGDMTREQRTLIEQSVNDTLEALADGLEGFDVPGDEADQDGERDGAARPPGVPAAAA